MAVRVAMRLDRPSCPLGLVGWVERAAGGGGRAAAAVVLPQRAATALLPLLLLLLPLLLPLLLSDSLRLAGWLADMPVIAAWRGLLQTGPSTCS